MGHEWYDLWGVAPKNEPDDPWHDISVFKRKFGGQELNLVPTLDYVYDPAAYDKYARTENETEECRDRGQADRDGTVVSQ